MWSNSPRGRSGVDLAPPTPHATGSGVDLGGPTPHATGPGVDLDPPTPHATPPVWSYSPRPPPQSRSEPHKRLTSTPRRKPTKLPKPDSKLL